MTAPKHLIWDFDGTLAQREGMWSGAILEAVFNSAETGVEKPNPLAFQNVLAFLGETKQVWVIGDSITADVNGARSAGLRAVLVRKPHAGAEVFCETLHELAAFLIAPG